MDDVVPLVEAVEQLGRVAPGGQPNSEAEQRVEQARKAQTPGDHQDHERKEQGERRIGLPREQVHHARGDERQSRQVERVAQKRAPVADQRLARDALAARLLTDRRDGGLRLLARGG